MTISCDGVPVLPNILILLVLFHKEAELRLHCLLPVHHSGIAHISGRIASNQTEEKTLLWARWQRAPSNCFDGSFLDLTGQCVQVVV